MSKNKGLPLLRTNLSGGGRYAGSGILYDNYDDESSGSGWVRPWERVRFPLDGEDWESLNGPVIEYRRKPDEKL